MNLSTLKCIYKRDKQLFVTCTVFLNYNPPNRIELVSSKTGVTKSFIAEPGIITNILAYSHTSAEYILLVLTPNHEKYEEYYQRIKKRIKKLE